MDGVGSALGGRRTGWTVLILAALFFLARFGELDACGEIPLTMDPTQPRTGQDVWLSPVKIPDHFIYCLWMHEQGTRTIAQYFKPPNENLNTWEPGKPGRITLYPNCSLHIKELKLTDSKVYMLKAGAPLTAMFGSINLVVSDANRAAPVSVMELVDNFNITMDPLEPKEGEDLWLLPPLPSWDAVNCTWSRGNTADTMQTITTFVRRFRTHDKGPGYTGREVHFRSCSLCIAKLQLADSSTYTVTISFPESTVSGSVNIQVSAAPASE